MQPQTDEQGTNQSAPAPGWQFTPNGDAQPPANQVEAPQQPQQPVVADLAEPTAQPAPQPQPSGDTGAVSWSASEFIAHQKNMSWYGLLVIAGSIFAALTYLLTKDKISTVMVFVVTAALGVFAGRKPRTLDYQVDANGVHIGPKSYPYEDFKSFSVIDEGAVSSISLAPLRRFMPAISMFYDPQDEEHITGVLSDYLPFEEGQKDVVDRFMHRIRF
jgi:hypothetical protein